MEKAPKTVQSAPKCRKEIVIDAQRGASHYSERLTSPIAGTKELVVVDGQ
jgi:hypothetical protein